MSDGAGTAFSSELVVEENGPSGQFNQTVRTPAEVDSMMKWFMGISERYVRMSTLPYDGIHHIDMHMKLLDEETLLVGEFPVGVSDGPQLEQNLQFIASNYNSTYGTPYELVRIPMPPSTGGAYPPGVLPHLCEQPLHQRYRAGAHLPGGVRHHGVAHPA